MPKLRFTTPATPILTDEYLAFYLFHATAEALRCLYRRLPGYFTMRYQPILLLLRLFRRHV